VPTPAIESTTTPVVTSTPATTDVAAAHKCHAAIVAAGSTLLQAEASARDVRAILAGKLARALRLPSRAEDRRHHRQGAPKLAATIAKACGGKDRTCGTGTACRWRTSDACQACPSVAGAGCSAVADCSDVAACVACAGDSAVVARSLAWRARSDQSQDQDRQGPQQVSGEHRTRRNDAARHRFGPANGTDAFAKTSWERTAVCKACGGADHACGGDDDIALAAIGFVAVPTSRRTTRSCGAPITIARGHCELHRVRVGSDARSGLDVEPSMHRTHGRAGRLEDRAGVAFVTSTKPFDAQYPGERRSTADR
jgi:hypothetical protein